MKRYIPIILAAALCLTGCERPGAPQPTETAPTPEITTAAAPETSAETLTEAAPETTAGATEAQSETAAHDGGYTEQELKDMARVYYGSRHNHDPEFVEGEMSDENTYNIQLYDLFDGHTTTAAWYFIDPATGKGHDMLDEPIDLTEPPAETWNPEIPQREQLAADNKFCGIVHIGFVGENMEYRNDNAAIREMFLQDDLALLYPWLPEIPEDHFAGSFAGNDLYLVIPADMNAPVVVTEYQGGEDYDIGPIYRSYDGAPFLLRCYIGDIWNDTRIFITDHEGEHDPFSILISGRDGSIEVNSDRVAVLRE